MTNLKLFNMEKMIDCDKEFINNNSINNIIGNLTESNCRSFKEELIMFLLPDIIHFLKYIHKISDSDTLICFVSRDCYILEKMYSKMYPNDNNFQYVYCSRKLCYYSKDNYIRYVNNILSKRKKTLWVDIQGSGDSHVVFFKKNFKKIPPKLFFKKNSLQLKFTDFSKYKLNNNEDDYINITSFKKKIWNLGGYENQEIRTGACLESLFRAPYTSIIDLDVNFQPIYESEYELLDSGIKKIMNTYKLILDNWIDTNKINLCVDKRYSNTNFEFCSNWEFLLGLDIDETITHTEPKVLKELVKYCKKYKAKIIVITARWDPFYSNHNGLLKDILNIIVEELDYPLDVWYNPFSKLYDNVKFMKVKQFNFARQELKINNKQKCMFVDDTEKTISLMKKCGYYKSVQVSDNKIKDGITPMILKKIVSLLFKKEIESSDQQWRNIMAHYQVPKHKKYEVGILNINKCFEDINSHDFENRKKEILLFFIPDIILFLRYIKKITDEDTHICFLSRDCYLLEKIYSRMYPEDNNYEYVFCSRKCLYDTQSSYVEYIRSILKKREKTLWIDIHGSGDSHVLFFKNKFNFVPSKIYFKLNSLQNRYVSFKDYVSKKNAPKDYKHIYSFKNYEWNIFDYKKDDLEGGKYIESLFRSFHKSVINVDKDHNPIFETEFDSLDHNLDSLLTFYNSIISNWWINPRINLRTDSSNYQNYSQENNTDYKGLMVLDLDDTNIDENSILKVESIIDTCLNMKIKIILISSIWNPFNTSEFSSIIGVTQFLLTKIPYQVEFWYNPMSQRPINNNFIISQEQIKLIQINISCLQIESDISNCILLTINNHLMRLSYDHGLLYSSSVFIENEINPQIILNLNKISFS